MSGTKSLTLLAPTNEAFFRYEYLGESNLRYFPSGLLHLNEFFFDHAFARSFLVDDLADNTSMTSLSGKIFRVGSNLSTNETEASFSPGVQTRKIGNEVNCVTAPIVIPDLLYSENFVVHGIDGFLATDWLSKELRDTLVENNLTVALEWLQRTAFLNVISSIVANTFFIPTNEAINALPSDAWQRYQSDPSLGFQVANHAIASNLYYRYMFSNKTFITLSCATMEIRVNLDETIDMMVFGTVGRVAKTDILHSKGLIHTVKRFLSTRRYLTRREEKAVKPALARP